MILNDKKNQKHKKFKDAVTYAYLRNIKKWMLCPNCKDGKMTVDKETASWVCSNCGYSLFIDVFENDYVFWFCDECGAYLNVQLDFDKTAARHTCCICGHENDTTPQNIKNICSNCGEIIPDGKSTLCEECQEARQEKTKRGLATAGKVLGTAAAVAGAIYAISKSDGDDDTNLEGNSNFADDNPPKGKFKVIFDGEEQDETFDTEEDAEEYALYLSSCTRTGAEILHWSNPGDYDYDEDTFEDPEYEIIEDD